MSVVGDALPADALPQRQCGRCRQLFEGDPTLHPTAIADWWACADCRIALRIGGSRGR
jgi:hypothetical protein